VPVAKHENLELGCVGWLICYLNEAETGHMPFIEGVRFDFGLTEVVLLVIGLEPGYVQLGNSLQMQSNGRFVHNLFSLNTMIRPRQVQGRLSTDGRQVKLDQI
jgi:hypothetical protein